VRQLPGAFRYRTGALMGEGARTPLCVAGHEPAWLALHGYCGAPEEMRLVIDVAKSGGFQAEAPVLPGHGTHARDLASLGFDDLYEGVRARFLAVAARGPVLVVGLSLGSLLGTRLCLEYPERVLGLVMLANAFFLNPFPSWPLRGVDRLGVRDFGVPKLGADIGDRDARRTHLSYSVQPVAPAISLLRAADRLFLELPRLACPSLVVHGAKDRLCPVSNAWRVAEQIGPEHARVVILPRSHHIVTRDFDREQLAAELRQFAQDLALSS
jgi:carboxylesterase